MRKRGLLSLSGNHERDVLMDKQAELDLDDSWINDLFQWTDRYDIPDLQYLEPEVDDDGVLLRDGYFFGLPRNRETLLKLEVLNLNGYIKSHIPDQKQCL